MTARADRPGLRARILSPLAALRARGIARRWAGGAHWHAPVPVVCVGSLDSGGIGRAQAVLAVVGHLQEIGRRPAILFGCSEGRLSGPVAVDPQKHTAADVGAETLLAATFAPVWIARDRRRGAEVILAGAQAGGAPADCIVMAGGFQDPSLFKAISVLVVEASSGFGNGLSRPAGPLREPLTRGLGRAGLVLSIGSDAAQVGFAQSWGERISCPTIRGRLEPLKTGMTWQGARFLAFAGIGQSEMFFAALRGLGADLVRGAALEDHHPPGAALMTRLEREAVFLGAQLVTTELEAVSLAPEIRRKVLSLPLRLQVEDWEPFDAALARIAPPAG